MSGSRFVHNVLHEEATSIGGGAIYTGSGVDMKVDGCYFAHNKAEALDGSTHGGAITVEESNRIIISTSTFLKNEATGDGGAIASFDVLNFVLSYSVVNGNAGAGKDGGGGVFIEFRRHWSLSGEKPLIEHTHFHDNIIHNAAGGGAIMWKVHPLMLAHETSLHDESSSIGGPISLVGYDPEDESIATGNAAVYGNFIASGPHRLFVMKGSTTLPQVAAYRGADASTRQRACTKEREKS